MRTMEHELYLDLLQGKRAAFRKFYDATCKTLTCYVASRVGNSHDVDELVQDTYLSFLDSLPLYRGKASLKTFLMSIARHEVADYWRKRYAKKAVQLVPFVDQGYIERVYSKKQLAARVTEAYARLKDEEVQLLIWKYEEGMSVKEMAQRMGVAVKAVESRLFRARKAFQYAYAELQG